MKLHSDTYTTQMGVEMTRILERLVISKVFYGVFLGRTYDYKSPLEMRHRVEM